MHPSRDLLAGPCPGRSGTIRSGEGTAFGIQVLVPVVWDQADDDTRGIGDGELRVGVVRRHSDSVRFGFGLNGLFDTATDREIGGGALVLRPILAMRWDANERLNLGINVEYSFRPRDECSGDVRALELKFPFATKFTDRWPASLT